ncbi:MAG: tyrosine-type recombinase/integrase [Pseudomonadota bacterium]
MATIRPRHIKRVRAKGRIYWYHQVTKERLPDDSEARARRVLIINKDLTAPKRHVRPGSVSALANQFRQSPAFKALAASTQATYRTYLLVIEDRWGKLAIADIRRKHVLGLRDKYGERPAAANMLIKVLGILIDFAIDREERSDNPAKGIKKLKTGPGHKAWPDWAVKRFLAKNAGMMRLAFLLGLYTGQRRSDVLAMRWADYKGGWISVRQIKTGVPLEIPCHTALKEALGETKKVGPMILTTAKGRPFEVGNFEHHWAKAMTRAGLDKHGLTFHGLRYTAASLLAEAGCNPKQIAAITGHRSLAMLAKYTSFADQKVQAEAAILTLERNTRATKLGKP